MKNTKNTNWPRLVVQWGVITFILLLAFIPGIFNIATPDFEAYCPFGGLQALGSYLLSDALSCTMTSAQIVMGILLLIGVVLFSKLFCSYICPIGTVSEWFGKLGEKLKIRFTIKGIADKILRSLKYILLFITLYFTLQSNELFCKKFDPYFGLASGFNSDVVVLYAVISIALVVLVPFLSGCSGVNIYAHWELYPTFSSSQFSLWQSWGFTWYFFSSGSK